MLAYVMLHRGDEVPGEMNLLAGWNIALSPVLSWPTNTVENTSIFNPKHPYTILKGKTHKGNTLSEEQTSVQK